MWVDAYRNQDLRNQATTGVVEGYHGYIKPVLDGDKCRLRSRRADWLIYQLIGIIMRHYQVQIQLQAC